MAASAAKNPKSRLLMPVIIPAAPSQSYALTSNLKCNDKRGALEERTPRFIKGGLSVLAEKPDLAQVAVPLIASSLVCLEVLPGLIVRRATHRPVSLDVVVVRLND